MGREETCSPPFAHRELNGETLVAELARLRRALVHQRHLNAAARALEGLVGKDIPTVPLFVERLNRERFKDQPVLAELLQQWAARVRTSRDVEALGQHFLRLARVSAVVGALWQSERARGEGHG